MQHRGQNAFAYVENAVHVWRIDSVQAAHFSEYFTRKSGISSSFIMQHTTSIIIIFYEKGAEISLG